LKLNFSTGYGIKVLGHLSNSVKYSFICQILHRGDSEGIFSVFEWSCHLLLSV